MEIGATAKLCALCGQKYVVLDSRDGPGPFRVASDVGVEVPIPWTASGRLLLGDMTEAEIRAFIPAEDYRLPDGHVLTTEAFLADVARARSQGFCETAALADRFTHSTVGLPPGEFPTPIFDVVLKRITMRGSIVGTRRDLDEANAFAVEGKVRVDITALPLSNINTIFADMKAG